MAVEYGTSLLLGILEGLTEFLPVSSTGHLILAGELLGFNGEGSVAFKIAIQLGAIMAVVVAYWSRFWNIGKGLLTGDAGARAFTQNIILGFLPAMVIGIFAYDAVREAIQTPILVAVMLILGGVIMLILDRKLLHVRYKSVEGIAPSAAASIGLVQCIAMIPGVSRSGATIIGGLFMGLDRKTAAEFSFFLAVPTMAAATAYALYKDRALLGDGNMTEIWIGLAAAFVVALMVVKAFVAIVGRHGFTPFAWYRIIVGSVALIWLLVR
jgi:undecaprenyl-diphosphatase